MPIQTNVLTPVRPTGQRAKELDSLAKAGLEIRVFLDGDEYTAVADPVSVATCGDTPEQARQSLLEAVAEYKEFLERSEVLLGPKLAEELRILRAASG